jgi:hypothetical protein
MLQQTKELYCKHSAALSYQRGRICINGCVMSLDIEARFVILFLKKIKLSKIDKLTNTNDKSV